MPRLRKRETDPLIRFRNMLEAQGLPAVTGLSRVGTFGGVTGGGLAPSLVQQPAATADTTGAAQLLVLSATGDAISSGDYVSFDAIVDQRGFDGMPTSVGDAWPHPISGVYVLVYEHEWSTYEGGGTIELEMDGEVVRTITSGLSGAQSVDVIGYYAQAGQVGRIKVTHADGSAQSCDATVQILVSDPALSDQPSTWRQLTSADVWGLTNDGTDWWTTEGVGLTVSQRDELWVETSSFEASALETGGVAGPVRGITWDGTHLWIVGEANTVVAKYTTAGVLASSFNPSWGGEFALAGIAFDGTDLWIVGNTTGQVRRYTTAGALQQTVTLSEVDHASDVAFHDGHLYIVDYDNARIAKYATDGTFLQYLDAADAGANPSGVWISADGYVFLARDDAGVWRRNTVIV